MTSFTAVKLLSLAVYPLGQVFILALFAFVMRIFRFSRSAFLTMFIGIAWLYLCSTSQFADALMGYLEEGYGSKPMSTVPQADAIVLLGGAMRGHTHLGSLADMNQQADRLVHAVALYKAGKASNIIVSGGGPYGDRPEAEQMHDILLIMGVPSSAIVLESRSYNTHDNAVYTAQLLQERGWQNILLVTSAFHMRRAVGLFEAQNIMQITAAPTDFQRRVAPPGALPDWLPLPGISNLYRTTHALHEIIGYAMYQWRGWL
ncbi:MAG: YdcF family protein [Halioglobus sp.]